jgi:hypothetical protein
MPTHIGRQRVMRSAVTAALVLALVAAGGERIPWRTARPADSVAKSSALSETWDLRAVAPNGRRAIFVRFWTKDNPYYIELLWYAATTTRGGAPTSAVSKGYARQRQSRAEVR